MINLKELEEGDILQYHNGFIIKFYAIEDDYVILKDSVIGEIKVLIKDFEKDYNLFKKIKGDIK